MEWKSFDVETPKEEKEYLIYYQPFSGSKFYHAIGKYIADRRSKGAFYRETGGVNNTSLTKINGTVYQRDECTVPHKLNIEKVNCEGEEKL